MAITCSVGGSARAVWIGGGGITIRTSITARNTASVDLISEDGSYTPAPGDPVQISDGTGSLLVGTVDKMATTWHHPADLLTHSLSVVGYDQIAWRRVCWASRHYAGETAGVIFADLVTQFLGGENVDVETVAGPTLATFDVLAGDFVHAKFDALAEATGLHWDIVGVPGNPLARLYALGTYTASTALVADGLLRATGPVVEKSREGLANRVWVKVRTGPGDPVSESFVGDGVSRQFTMADGVVEWPQVTVNGSGEIVKVLDAGESGQWYWSPGSAIITQDTGEPLLDSGDDIIVDYTPAADAVLMLAEDTADIAARDAQEGLSGKYETIIDAADGQVISGAQALAESYLTEHTPVTAGGPMVVRVRISVHGENDYAAGKTLTLPPEIRTPLGMPDTTYLIEDCEKVCRKIAGGSWRTTITASTGAVIGDWRRRLAAAWAGADISSSTGSASASNTAAGAAYVS